MPAEAEIIKRKNLRHNEYYNMQEVFDNLYKKSKQGNKLNKIYEIIISRGAPLKTPDTQCENDNKK